MIVNLSILNMLCLFLSMLWVDLQSVIIVLPGTSFKMNKAIKD